jgi:NADH-quinone oxidoreductase subunit N
VTGLGRSRTGAALLMVLFLFSLIGIPLTAGFAGKLLLFAGAIQVPYSVDDPASLQQYRLFVILALIGVLNAAVGAWYYLRIAAAMFLREPIQVPARARRWPVMAAIAICAVLTLWGGVYPWPILRTVQNAVPRAAEASGAGLVGMRIEDRR